MKNLLYLISILFLSFCILSCQSNKASGDVNKEGVSADSAATSVDTLVSMGDSLAADSVGKADAIGKEEKYDSNTTEKHEAPDHKSPDEAKLDSIKNAKKKKKKD